MTTPAIAKRAYSAVALFALLNMIALGGGAAYLCGAGVIDGDKLRLVAAVLRGEELIPPTAVEAKPAEETDPKTVQEPGDVALAEAHMGLEITRREADRIKEELRQQLALANSIMIRVTSEREVYRKELEENSRQQEAADAEHNAEGFKKQIEILKGLKPKVAIGHILAMKDPNEAARILQDMGTRSAKKIIEAVKGDQQMTQMREILRIMREAGKPNRDREGAAPKRFAQPEPGGR